MKNNFTKNAATIFLQPGLAYLCMFDVFCSQAPVLSQLNYLKYRFYIFYTISKTIQKKNILNITMAAHTHKQNKQMAVHTHTHKQTFRFTKHYLINSGNYQQVWKQCTKIMVIKKTD